MRDPVALADRLCASLSLEPADLDLFEMALDEWLGLEIELAHDYFGGVPEQLSHELADIRATVLALELELGRREEWERCARVRDLRARAL